jgi:RimJ/RimL family protein N-acetyltransferase
MLINIDEDAYFQIFTTDPHGFLSRKFLNLNRSKVDKIFALVNDNSKPLIGLFVGLKDGYLLSPFSAPFGGIHFTNELIHISVINEFIKDLQSFIKINGFAGIKITFPPNLYYQTINSKFIHGLFYGGFNIKTIDITSWVDLESFNDWFQKYSVRKCLNQALKHGLSFKQTKDLSEKVEAYEIIRKNRILNGRDIYMSFNDLNNTNEIWDVDYFVVYDRNNIIVASSINYRFHNSIVYAVFWGDIENGRSQRAMDFCIYNLLKHYKQFGYKYLDVGISTKNGIPNEGLLRFKELHQASSSLRYTFNWENDQIKEKKVKQFNFNPIIRYGITLRLVELEDAAFIFELRNNTALNKFLSFTSPNLDDQIKWLKNYKTREKAGLEFYFIVQDLTGNKCGTIRLSNLDEKSFEIGSWLFNKNAPIGMAVKAHFIGFEIGFEFLKAEYSRFDIRKKNIGVLRYMKDFETTLVREDDMNFYYTLTKESFYKRRNQISIFNSSSNK